MSRERTIEDLTSLNFTAIDFETANEKRHSLCAIGVARVRNGVITENWKQYVRPAELRFANINRSVHGIPDGVLIASPDLVELWEEMLPRIEDHIVIAHNAVFDLNVFKQTLDHHGFKYPVDRSLCTLKLSQLAYPDLPRHGLADVCAHLSLEFRHHDCAEDARVCAEIALRALRLVALDTLNLDGPDITGPVFSISAANRSKAYSASFAGKRIDHELLTPNLESADPQHPFYGKRIVFTGDLTSMPRNTAATRVSALGADINKTISPRTQLVIMGQKAGPAKLKKIEELITDGVEIIVIEEPQFMEILENPEPFKQLLRERHQYFDSAIEVLATQLTIRHSEVGDLPMRYRPVEVEVVEATAEGTETEQKNKERHYKSIEVRFKANVKQWCRFIVSTLERVESEQAWRWFRSQPLVPDGISGVTDCPEFLAFNNYFAQRRDTEECPDAECGQLALLLTDVQREIEKRLVAAQTM